MNVYKHMCVYIYICKSESFCCIFETNTTLKINYTSIKKKILLGKKRKTPLQFYSIAQSGESSVFLNLEEKYLHIPIPTSQAQGPKLS